MSVETMTTTEAGDALADTLERFRREGVNARPVVFGDEGRAEGVVLAFEAYEQLRHEISQARFLADTELQAEIAAMNRDPSLGVKIERQPRSTR